MVEYNKICPICEKNFIAKRKDKIYCSKKCREKQYYKDNKEYFKQYREDNKEKIAEYQKQYYQDNREKIKQYCEDNKEKKKEYDKQYRQDNKEKIAEYRRQYYQDNKDQIVEYKKQYHQDNRDKISEYKKQYRQDNKEKIAEYQKQYYQDNRDKILEHQKQYYEDRIDKLIQYYSDFNNIPIQDLEYLKYIPNGDRILETEFKYIDFGNASEGYERHHIIPYRTCIYYRNLYTKYSKEWDYWNNKACDKNNSIDLPIEVHKMLHSRLAKNSYGIRENIPLDEFDKYETLVFRLIDEINEELYKQTKLDNY